MSRACQSTIVHTLVLSPSKDEPFWSWFDKITTSMCTVISNSLHYRDAGTQGCQAERAQMRIAITTANNINPSGSAY